MSEKIIATPGSRLHRIPLERGVDSLSVKLLNTVEGATASPHPASWECVAGVSGGGSFALIATAWREEDGAGRSSIIFAGS